MIKFGSSRSVYYYEYQQVQSEGIGRSRDYNFFKYTLLFNLIVITIYWKKFILSLFLKLFF